jgi:hypothetical protein
LEMEEWTWFLKIRMVFINILGNRIENRNGSIERFIIIKNN